MTIEPVVLELLNANHLKIAQKTILGKIVF